MFTRVADNILVTRFRSKSQIKASLISISGIVIVDGMHGNWNWHLFLADACYHYSHIISSYNVKLVSFLC